MRHNQQTAHDIEIICTMPKLSIAEKRAKLEADLKILADQEKQEQQTRFIALGEGVDAAMKADSHLKTTFMEAISTHLRNNKQRELLGLEKLSSNKGRPKSVEVVEPPATETTGSGFLDKIRNN